MPGLFSAVGDLLGLNYDIPQVSYNPTDITTGYGGVTFDPTTGAATTSLSPEMQAQVDQLLSGATGAFTAANQFDPYAAADTLFSRMENILAGGRTRQQGQLESRLLAQGRLGSTGGMFDQQALNQAIEAQRAQNLNQSFGTAQAVQQGLFNQGIAGLNAAMGVQQMPLALANLGISAGTGQMNAQMFNAQNQIQQNQLMPNLLTSLGTGALTGYMMGGLGGAAAGGGLTAGQTALATTPFNPTPVNIGMF